MPATSASSTSRKDDTLRDLAIAGGVTALVLWLLANHRAFDSLPLRGLEAFAPVHHARRRPCQARLSSKGWELNGQRVTGLAEVIAACRDRGAVSVWVTGGALSGEVLRMRKAFAAAGIQLNEARPRHSRTSSSTSSTR